MAKSRSIGGIYASLSLRDGGFKAGLKSARKGLNDFGGKAAKGAAIGVAGMSTALAAAAVAGTKHTLSMVDDLGDVAKQTGVGVADMMKLQQAYKMGGRAAEMTGKDIGKMQQNIVKAASGGDDPFSSIGLSAKELLQLNPAAQFDQIGAAIMRISNPAERTAKAMEIFGKGGMGLTTVFDGLPGAAVALGRMPELAQKFAAAMGEANDLIGNLPLKSDQFFVGFTSGIIGQLLPNLQKIDDFDFTTLGENIGNALGVGFEILTSGKVWELFTLHAEKALTALEVSPAMNNLAAAVNAFWDAATTTNGASNGTFSKNYEKYKTAGVDASTDAIDELQAQIDAIANEAKSKFDFKKSAAANLSITPPIVNPIEGLSAQASVKERDVNDYQRRGLSLGGVTAPVSTEDTKQTQLMTEMRNFLKRMAEEGTAAAF
jgi:hypothetical protein